MIDSVISIQLYSKELHFDGRIVYREVMNWIFQIVIFLVGLSAQVLGAPSVAKLKMLYNSMDPTSIAQHVAFYELYGNTPEGQKALEDACTLLCGHRNFQQMRPILPNNLEQAIQSIIAIVNKPPNETSLELNDEQLAVIDTFASHLPNRWLKGYQATTEEEVLKLPPEEIDLTRGVLLSQFGDDPNALRKSRSYEASIDLMALQILARLPEDATPRAKIKAINHYIFEELGFRFPPHSTYAKAIDLYSFLPSVLDSRRGVCLGVSILYLCLAQRLNLHLEIVTPPGHIYVRWREGNQTINIETTARGIELPDEEYLGIDTRSLEQRNIKETIGMAHFNQASLYWERQQYDLVKKSYEKAAPYLPESKILTLLLGYANVILGNEQEGRNQLTQVVNYLPEESVSKETGPEDYLKGNCSAEGLKAVFLRVDKKRESLLEKKKALEEVLAQYPKFREGLFSLAGTWLQLHRTQEALGCLNLYHSIDPNNAAVEYYLAAIYAERRDYNRAWHHLHLAEELVRARNHNPKSLIELKRELATLAPE